MDDMGRFERDLGIGLEQLAGPSLPVDASAVAHGVTAPTSRWRLGSPLRTLGLVTAAIVIVLLVGLAGVRLLSAPDAVDIEPATPTVTTDELLASMTTADVGAGVLEVIDDGAGHRLDSDESRAAGIETVHIGPGGDIWVRTRRAPDDFKNSVWQVGRPSTHIAGRSTTAPNTCRWDGMARSGSGPGTACTRSTATPGRTTALAAGMTRVAVSGGIRSALFRVVSKALPFSRTVRPGWRSRTW